MDQAKIEKFEKTIASFSSMRVAVIGDVMLDRYYWGTANRLSPEAPVPVCLVREESEQLGGAANVGNNLKTLGAEAHLFGVVGDDQLGTRVRSLLSNKGFSPAGIIAEAKRPTTEKLRVIAEDHHIVRVDRETTSPISAESQHSLLKVLETRIAKLNAIIFEDYNKGVLSPSLIKAALEIAKKHNVLTTVDPKFDNFFEFKGATVFKPNRGELERVLDSRLTHENEERLVRSVMQRLECRELLLTLGKQGMALYIGSSPPVRVPALVRDIHDVSGAGDTVISVYTLSLAAGASSEEAMLYANLAAAVVCGKVGAQPLTCEELRAAFMDYVQ